MNEPQLTPLAVTTIEAAGMLGISDRHLTKLSADGRLGPSPIRLGHSLRWSVDELRAWLAAGCPHREQWQAMKADRMANASASGNVMPP